MQCQRSAALGNRPPRCRARRCRRAASRYRVRCSRAAAAFRATARCSCVAGRHRGKDIAVPARRRVPRSADRAPPSRPARRPRWLRAGRCGPRRSTRGPRSGRRRRRGRRRSARWRCRRGFRSAAPAMNDAAGRCLKRTGCNVAAVSADTTAGSSVSWPRAAVYCAMKDQPAPSGQLRRALALRKRLLSLPMPLLPRTLRSSRAPAAERRCCRARPRCTRAPADAVDCSIVRAQATSTATAPRRVSRCDRRRCAPRSGRCRARRRCATACSPSRDLCSQFDLGRLRRVVAAARRHVARQGDRANRNGSGRTRWRRAMRRWRPLTLSLSFGWPVPAATVGW